MIIRRARRARNFTVVGNAVLEDERLTEELGVLIYLLSRPDDWRVSAKQLQARFQFGRDKIHKILKSLRDLGYARLVSYHDPETGKWAGKGYVISDEPNVLDDEEEAAFNEAVAGPENASEPQPVGEQDENPTTSGSPSPENPDLVENDATHVRISRKSCFTKDVKSGHVLLRTESLPNTESLPKAPQSPPGGWKGEKPFEEFDQAWRWSETEAKPPAQRVWRSLTFEEQDLAIRRAPAYHAAIGRTRRMPKNAATWLRDKGWLTCADPETGQQSKVFIPKFLDDGKINPKFAAWARHHGKETRELFAAEIRLPDGQRVVGRYEASEWPPPKGAKANDSVGRESQQESGQQVAAQG